MLSFRPAELQALNEKLKTFSTKTGKKAVRLAAREAMKPVRDDVKRNAPFDPTPDGKHIKANVALKTGWKGNTLTAKVGIKGGARKNPDTPFYWRMQEFGTKHIAPNPFIGPALDSNKQKVLDTLTAELKKALGL